MDGRVVDASAVAALLFNEPEGAMVASFLGDHRLFAPTLLRLELANVCLKKIRRDAARRDLLRAAYATLPDFELEFIDVDTEEVLDLAEATGLTAYDASYLWLARQLDVMLITLDKKLAARMGN